MMQITITTLWLGIGIALAAWMLRNWWREHPGKLAAGRAEIPGDMAVLLAVLTVFLWPIFWPLIIIGDAWDGYYLQRWAHNAWALGRCPCRRCARGLERRAYYQAVRKGERPR